MKEGKIQQLKHESDGWKRELKFILKENSFLVHRLSEVLKLDTSRYSLEEMEIYLDKFIFENNTIKRLQNELLEFDRLLDKEMIVDGKIIALVEKNYAELNNKICTTERGFNKLKKEFNRYLTKNIISGKN